ncbi:DinB family protein [Vallicoccus soli]|uniref:DinB family protein n=1 Tax=Vallicoccus soli TaxID=2339232 RepID=UPI001402E954|nr:DinB family protein [Vallicoccus soli]
MSDDGGGATTGRRHGVAEPGHRADEAGALLGFLQRQRDLVAWKVGGADDAALRAVATPTGLTAHGVVRHLENVERDWVRRVFAGEQGLAFDWTDEDPDGELHVPVGVPMAALLAAYAEESRRCDAVVAAASLDDVSSTGGFRLRWILLHLVEETARHLGHLDLLRELADGAVGEEPSA